MWEGRLKNLVPGSSLAQPLPCSNLGNKLVDGKYLCVSPPLQNTLKLKKIINL